MAETKYDGINRVFGLQIKAPTTNAQPGNKPPADFAKARDSWREAIETVDGRIEALAQALRATRVPVLQEIAEYGLNAVTANHKVPLMAAIMSLGAGTPEALAKGGAKALRLAQAFRTHIETDERVAVCDDNPLGLPVSIRDTLKPTLERLEAVLATSAGS